MTTRRNVCLPMCGYFYGDKFNSENSHCAICGKDQYNTKCGIKCRHAVGFEVLDKEQWAAVTTLIGFVSGENSPREIDEINPDDWGDEYDKHMAALKKSEEGRK